MNLMVTIATGLVRVYFKLFHRLKVTGRENIPEGGAILASNHTSFFDPPLVAAGSPKPVLFLGNERLFKNRFFGWLIRSLNCHPVSNRPEDFSVLRKISRLVKGGEQVLIFPEGTRCDDGKLKPFKVGVAVLASLTDAPVVPIFLEGAYDALKKGARFPRLGTKIRCHFGKPLCWQEFAHLPKKEAREAFVAELRRRVVSLDPASQSD